jgi:hypothetical protein
VGALELNDIDKLAKGYSKTEHGLLNLDEADKYLLKTLNHVKLNAKGTTHHAPILLTPHVQKAINTIRDFRDAAGVLPENPFLFACPTRVIISLFSFLCKKSM